jgi:hypothetical protein
MLILAVFLSCPNFNVDSVFVQFVNWSAAYIESLF